MINEIKVRVTRENINNGQPGSFAFCPIAHAVRQALPGTKKRVRVGDCIRVGNSVFQLPRAADDFITRFDDNLVVRPFTFIAKRAVVNADGYID